jgi:glyoxylase-like metal-dependent hydrolase (beta-lactamase superfamily II)/rhodanese-related sulfurtransferase
MLIEQIIRSDIGCASYVVADERAGVAAVVDPRWDLVDDYVGLARERGLRIVQIFETHVHADHVSGCRRLAARTGATIAIGAAAHVGYPATALHDGAAFSIGGVSIRAVETPGHSPDSLSFLLRDAETGQEHLLTGDCLFVGDVGRPDLHGTDGSVALYQSLQRLLEFPDPTVVYPAHVAGSLCGRSLSSDSSSTIGRERRANLALQIDSADAFVASLNAELPARPPNFHFIIALNRAGPPLDLPAPEPIQPDQVAPLLANGAILLDARSDRAFLGEHLVGAYHVSADDGSFNGRAAWILPAAAPIIRLVEREDQVRRAADALAAVGHLGPVRYSPAPLAAWQAAGFRTDGVPEIRAHELRRRLEGPRPPLVLDVREPAEYEAGHVPGAINIPFRLLDRRISDVPADADRIVVACAGGVRSLIAASLLQRLGRRRVWNLVGGTDAWKDASFPLEVPAHSD